MKTQKEKKISKLSSSKNINMISNYNNNNNNYTKRINKSHKSYQNANKNNNFSKTTLKFPLIFLLLISINIQLANTQNNCYQAIWYSSQDDSNHPAKHYMGLKNFYSANERSYYYNSDIEKRNSNNEVVVRVNREYVSGSENGFAYGNSNYNKLEKQFSYYFPKMDFTSQNGGYFVLEDESTANDILYCENRFYVRHYRNFRLARIEYERLLAIGGKKILMGGPEGISDSNEKDFFIRHYMNPWCEWRFGIFSNDPYTTSNPFANESFHVYLSDSTDPADNNFDWTDDANPAAGTYDECFFTEEADDITFMPSDFDTHCVKQLASNSPDTPSDTSAPSHYIYCGNVVSSNSAVYGMPYYYLRVGECEKNGRAFMKLQKVADDVAISVDVNCTDAATTTYPQATLTPTGSEEWSDFYSAPDTGVTIASDTGNIYTCSVVHTPGPDPPDNQAAVDAACPGERPNYNCEVTANSPAYLRYIITETVTTATQSDPSTWSYDRTFKIKIDFYKNGEGF